ncbi:MAG: head GIN domain-containing protein [Saprospiraceae bacterium]
MSRITLLFSALLLSFSVFAQSKSFTPGAFDMVAVNYGIDAVIKKGAKHSVSIEADQSVLDVVQVVVEGEQMKITFDQKDWNRLSKSALRKGIKATIITPALSGVLANGGSDVVSKDKWSGDSFKMTANGGADLTLIVDVKNLKVVCNGGADIYLSGSADKVKMTANGGADIEAENLMTKDADLTANGAGDISINVSKSLKARANGGSDIEYYGNATMIDVRANGGSDIDRG